MSAGGYDAPHLPPGFSRYEPRRPSGPMQASYDRLPNPASRRRTPSPPSLGLARRPYDSYVPMRSEVPFREPVPNVYRPNNYRPGEYSAPNYYSPSPSPDTYGLGNPSRMPEAAEGWDRGSAWRAPPEAPNMWPDRKIIPASPTSVPGRGLRDESSRFFEPSDSWKQNHHDRPSRIHPSPPSDRYFDRRNRASMDVSPERPMRNERNPPFIPGGDRYRSVPNKRETFPPGRSDYDSYRPQYENWTPPFRREPVSPAGSHNRRDSGSVHARTSDRFDSPFSSRAVSRKTSPSPRPVVASTPPSNPNRISLDLDNEPWSHPPPPTRIEAPTRAPSRSSIASTHVSDRKSPPAPVVITPVITAQPSLTSDNSKNRPLSVDEKISDTQAETRPDPKSAQNGISEQSGVASSTEPKSIPKPVSPVIKKPATNVPSISQSNDVTAIKQSLSITHSPRQNPPKVPEVIIEKDAVIPAKPSTNGAPVSAPTPAEKPVSVVSSPPRPVFAEPLPKPATDFLEIKQPQPLYIPSPVLSPLISPTDIHIPSPTHSPILSTPPPIDEPPSPPVIQKSIPRPDEIPPISEAKTTQEALRIIVMTRLLCDRQSKEERVAPVLAANMAIANPPEAHPIATPDTLLEWMNSGQVHQDRLKSFVVARPRLVQYLDKRNSMIEEKATRLREEYVSLQESWVAHCNALNEQQKTLASEHENQHGGRTTRRSTAITDAVRSDFEMEQIIASLGVDEATDPNHLSMRNVAKIPDMITVTKGQVDYLFDDMSHWVENPSEYYAPHTGIQDWTDAEKQIFLDKYAAHPKQFGIIADYIPNKTAAQCVDFYYLHKKQKIDFRKVVSLFAPNKRKRRGMGKKKGNGLLVDIAKHDMEVNLGKAAAASPSVSTRTPRGRKPAVPAAERKTTRRSVVQFEDTPTSTPTPEPDARPRRRRGVNATSSTSASAPTSAIASTVYSIPVPTPTSTAAPTPRSVTPIPVPIPVPPPVIPTPPIVIPEPPRPTPVIAETPPEPEIETRPAKRVKRTRKIKSAATVSDDPSSPGPEADKELPANGNDADSNSRAKKDKLPLPNQWSEEDKNQFLSLLSQYGDDFKRIAASMPNKTTIQVSNFYKTHAVSLDLQKVAARAPKRSPTPEHHEVWKELPQYPGSGVIHHVTTMKPGPSSVLMSSAPPMSSLSGDPNRSNAQHGSAYSRDSGSTRSGSPSRHSRNPYPPMSSSQSSMAHPYSDALRPTYSPPTGSTPYPYPTDHRGVYMSSRPPDSSFRRPSGPSSPTLQSRPHFAPSYPPSSSSSSTAASSSRSGYVPAPPTGPSAPSIIHSPTGMSPPKSLPVQPVQPMQSYPAHQSDPAHRTPYLSYPQPSHSANGYWTPAPFYNADGTPYMHPRGPNDNGARRDHPYAMYPAVSGPSGSGSRPPPQWASQPGPPSSVPGASRQPYYYPGWTSG